eukprot:m.352076 g.352076  ORF g.352076 m.352076 type:complete len:96 (+) comp16580_c1_seq15:4090-4377(+)
MVGDVIMQRIEARWEADEAASLAVSADSSSVPLSLSAMCQFTAARYQSVMPFPSLLAPTIGCHDEFGPVFEGSLKTFIIHVRNHNIITKNPHMKD